VRRRHVQTIREEERPTLLLMAAGAVVGAAAGLFLGRRYRTMDSFVEDMRDKFSSLRDVWYEAEELGSGRRERVALDDDELDADEDGIDVEEDDEEYDDLDDDEAEAAAYETEDAYHEDVFDDEDEDDDEDIDEDDAEDEDEFEEELAAVGRDNGVSESTQRAADAARQLEERVLVVMRDDPVLRTRNIEIAVVGDGVVELSGNVHTIEEVSRAAAEVRGTPGVSMVLNRLEVRTGGTIETASTSRDSAKAATPQENS
jgi:hypothetical protein